MNALNSIASKSAIENQPVNDSVCNLGIIEKKKVVFYLFLNLKSKKYI